MDDEGPERKQKKELSSSISDGSNFSKPFGFRHSIQDDLGLDRILLAYNGYFLPGISILLWIIFLAIR
jgi:hypothetical protein